MHRGAAANKKGSPRSGRREAWTNGKYRCRGLFGSPPSVASPGSLHNVSSTWRTLSESSVCLPWTTNLQSRLPGGHDREAFRIPCPRGSGDLTRRLFRVKWLRSALASSLSCCIMTSDSIVAVDDGWWKPPLRESGVVAIPCDALTLLVHLLHFS